VFIIFGSVWFGSVNAGFSEARDELFVLFLFAGGSKKSNGVATTTMSKF